MNDIKLLDGHQIHPAPSLQNLRDLQVSFHGNISLFQPLTDMAREWMQVHCPRGTEHQYSCGSLVVEARYVEDLLAHAVEDGLKV